MTPETTHEQATEEIEAVALGIAADDVIQAVTAHAVRCPECAAELRSFYHVVAALSLLVPSRQLNRGHSAGIKSRLMAKVAAHEGGPGRRPGRAEPARAVEPAALVARPARIEGTPTRQVTDRPSTTPLWIAAIATLIALGSLAALVSSRGDRAVDGAAPEPVTDESRVAELESAVAERDTLIASISGPGVRVIGLYNREAREPLARMFWDRRNDRWTLFVYSLRQPRAGKTFQVWLGTDNGRVSLGTFTPASDGNARLSARHAVPIAALNTVSISEEDVGRSVSAPTGPVVLAGALR